MYAVTSTPLERRTRATFRRAELGFFGVMILTCKQTPLRCGQPCKAGCLGRRYSWAGGLRTSGWIVGMGRESTQFRSAPPVGTEEAGGVAARAATGNHYRSGARQAGQEGTDEVLPLAGLGSSG